MPEITHKPFLHELGDTLPAPTTGEETKVTGRVQYLDEDVENHYFLDGLDWISESELNVEQGEAK